MNTINLQELRTRNIKVSSTKAVKSFVVGYHVDNDGFAVDASGKRIEGFPGEALLKGEYNLLLPYEKEHKGRAAVKLKSEKGKHLGCVYRGNEMMRYLLARIVVPNASASFCALLRTLMEIRQGRDIELVTNGLPLVGLKEFRRGLTPLIEKRELEFGLKHAQAAQRHRPMMPSCEVGPKVLAQDMCD